MTETEEKADVDVSEKTEGLLKEREGTEVSSKQSQEKEQTPWIQFWIKHIMQPDPRMLTLSIFISFQNRQKEGFVLLHNYDEEYNKRFHFNCINANTTP